MLIEFFFLLFLCIHLLIIYNIGPSSYGLKVLCAEIQHIRRSTIEWIKLAKCQEKTYYIIYYKTICEPLGHHFRNVSLPKQQNRITMVEQKGVTFDFLLTSPLIFLLEN